MTGTKTTSRGGEGASPNGTQEKAGGEGASPNGEPRKTSKARQRRKARAARRAKGGRPKIEGVLREPNGRVSRAKVPLEPIDKLALEVRARQFGVDVEKARDPRLGSYIGRLAILGTKDGAGGISDIQYQAAMSFLEVRNNYLQAIQSAAAAWHEGQGSSDGLGYEATVARDKARYEAMMTAAANAQNETAFENFYAALQYLVIEDKPIPAMVGTLRLVLNALARHFRLG